MRDKSRNVKSMKGMKDMKSSLAVMFTALLAVQSPPRPLATRAPFGAMPDGTKVEVFTLTNAAGMEVRTIPYGAIIVSIRVPDRNGKMDDVVLGHDTLDKYFTASRFFGAVVGRYGNRIAKGKFTLDGQDTRSPWQRPEPTPRREGLHKVLWRAAQFASPSSSGVTYRARVRMAKRPAGPADATRSHTLTPQITS